MRVVPLAVLLLTAFTGDVFAQVSWPPLPTSGYIVGRAATQADVQSGKATFALAPGSVPVSTPLPLKIPQYAYLDDQGKRVSVILVQAEEANGKQVAGVLMADGSTSVTFLSELVLLGTRLPSDTPRKPAKPLRPRGPVE